jgi:hypothetical protein
LFLESSKYDDFSKNSEHKKARFLKMSGKKDFCKRLFSSHFLYQATYVFPAVLGVVFCHFVTQVLLGINKYVVRWRIICPDLEQEPSKSEQGGTKQKRRGEAGKLKSHL